jgi:hypothetical protein
VVPGTVVKVKCSDSEALNKGSGEVTCSSGTDFRYSKQPSCSKIGKFSTKFQSAISKPAQNPKRYNRALKIGE